MSLYHKCFLPANTDISNFILTINGNIVQSFECFVTRLLNKREIIKIRFDRASKNQKVQIETQGN